MRQAHLSTHPGLTLDSPPLTLCSPALRVGAGKSGVGESEWKVSSKQISVVLICQEIKIRSEKGTCCTDICGR
jgi:hypothetical protein